MTYFGLYRGYVVDNDDSGEDHGYLGRIRVAIPEVYGEVDEVEKLPWAWPCIQAYAGGLYSPEDESSNHEGVESDEKIASGMITIPPVGSTVWVMFEQGDPQVPVYMGSWIGKGTEMPAAAKTGYSNIGGTYPQIFLLKMPWGNDMFLRALGDRMFELSFGDMHIQMKAESAEDVGDGELFIWTEATNIRIATTDGTLTLQAKEITMWSLNDMRIQAGEYETNEETGEITVKTEGSMRVDATKDMVVHGQEKNVIQSMEELQGRAEKVSGFDKHGVFEGAGI